MGHIWTDENKNGEMQIAVSLCMSLLFVDAARQEKTSLNVNIWPAADGCVDIFRDFFHADVLCFQRRSNRTTLAWCAQVTLTKSPAHADIRESQ